MYYTYEDRHKSIQSIFSILRDFSNFYNIMYFMYSYLLKIYGKKRAIKKPNKGKMPRLRRWLFRWAIRTLKGMRHASQAPKVSGTLKQSNSANALQRQ